MNRDRWIAAGLALVAALLFVQSVNFGFAMDDNGLIKQNELVKNPARFHELWTTDYWYPKQQSGLYRPLPKATYALNYAIGGLDPRGYHAVTVMLHAIMTALVYVFLMRVTRDRWLSGLAGLLFAVLAVHTEVAANTTFGRPETMAGILAILAMLAYLKIEDGDPLRKRVIWYGISLTLFFPALLCKESSVTIIGILALYDFCWRSDTTRGFFVRIWQTLRKRFVPGYLGYCVMVAAYMGLRVVALAGTKATPPHITLDNPIVGLGLPWRPINALYVTFFHYGQKLVWPAVLSHDYSYDAIPMIKAWSDWRILSTAVACLAFIAFCVWAYRKSTVLFFGVMTYVITFSVVSNVIVLIGTVLGERLLYFPSMAFCLVAAWLIIEAARKIGSGNLRRQLIALAAITAVVVGGNVGRTLDRLQDWKDEYTLYIHDAGVVSRSAKALNNAGALSIKYQKYEQGLEYLHRSMELNPLGYPIPYYTAALAYTTIGEDAKAAEMYEKSLLNGDRDPFTRNNLGFILVDHEMDVARGVTLIEEAVSAWPENGEFRDSLAWGYFKLGRFEEALEQIELALQFRAKKGKEPHPGHLEHKEQILAALEQRERLRRSARPNAQPVPN